MQTQQFWRHLINQDHIAIILRWSWRDGRKSKFKNNDRRSFKWNNWRLQMHDSVFWCEIDAIWRHWSAKTSKKLRTVFPPQRRSASWLFESRSYLYCKLLRTIRTSLVLIRNYYYVFFRALHSNYLPQAATPERPREHLEAPESSALAQLSNIQGINGALAYSQHNSQHTVNIQST